MLTMKHLHRMKKMMIKTNNGFQKMLTLLNCTENTFISHSIERQKKWLGHNETYNVPDFMIAVAWQDGCDGQLKLVTIEEWLDEDERRSIVAYKQSAARTTTEQSADISSCFKTFRNLQKDMTIKDTRSFRNKGLILLRIEKVIREKETSGELILESFKFNAIVHMISKMPS